MIVQLDPKTRIVGTERAWELQRPHKRKGKVTWEPYKWFTSFGSALEKAVHRDIRIHPANRMSNYINVSPRTLDQWAWQKINLPYAVVAGKRWYRRSDAEHYLFKREVKVSPPKQRR